jgi:hypothetical protein
MEASPEPLTVFPLLNRGGYACALSFYLDGENGSQWTIQLRVVLLFKPCGTGKLQTLSSRGAVANVLMGLKTKSRFVIDLSDYVPPIR